jgi:hypothetical protein
MQAVQTNSTDNLLPVVHDYFFKQPILRTFINKSEQKTYSNGTERKASKKRRQLSKIGLVIPFQPCIWNKNKVEAVWNEAMEMAERKMKGKYISEHVSKLMIRLRNMFKKLNFNTHRKSLAIIISEEVESIVYLNFYVKSSSFYCNAVSWLQIADKIKLEPAFYYLVLNADYTTLYDFNNERLGIILENKNEACLENNFKKIIDAIELLNTGYKKPVFFTGNVTIMKQFCNKQDRPNNYFPIPDQELPFYLKNIQPHVKVITRHWIYWRSKFITNTINTCKTEGYTSNTDAVIQALSKGADGLLLIDKQLKQQLLKIANTKRTVVKNETFMNLIEKFLSRGNWIEFTTPGLLKDVGGIVLLNNTRSLFSEETVSTIKTNGAWAGELF